MTLPEARKRLEAIRDDLQSYVDECRGKTLNLSDDAFDPAIFLKAEIRHIYLDIEAINVVIGETVVGHEGPEPFLDQ